MIAKAIRDSTQTIKREFEEILSNKRLSRKIPIVHKDEMGDIVVMINDLLDGLSAIVGDAKKSSLENAAVAEELSVTSFAIGRRTEDAAKTAEAKVANDPSLDPEHAARAVFGYDFIIRTGELEPVLIPVNFAG